MNLWPIYVPSSGRAGHAPTLQWLAGEWAAKSAILCVDLDEAEDYKREYPRIRLIYNNIKPHTLVGARQSILNHARLRGHAWHWQIDDDVHAFGMREKPAQKSTPVRASVALARLQPYSQIPRAALIAPDFRQFAWHSKTEYSLNQRCMVVIGVNGTTGLNFDTNLPLKSDIDFCLQNFTAGWRSVLSHLVDFSYVEQNGNTRGGNVDQYKTPGLQESAVRHLCMKWPTVAKPVFLRHGRPEVKINWACFSKK